MNKYVERFDEIFKRRFTPEEAREEIKPLALALVSDLEKKDYLLGAGIVAKMFITDFWGDWDSMKEFGELSLKLLTQSSRKTNNALLLALSYIEMSSVYNRFRFPGPVDVSLRVNYIYHRRKAAEVIAERFVNDSKKEPYLIYGFNLLTDLSRHWEPQFVEYEVEEGHSSWSNGMLRLSIPGAFQLLIGIPDYARAHQIAELAPGGFRFPGVCGWREVCKGILHPDQAHVHYLEAAKHMAKDTRPEDMSSREKPYWSNFNTQILAPYFRARAALSQPHPSSDDIVMALKQASEEIQPDASGPVHVPARKFAILVHGLGSFLETKDESVLDQLLEKYQKEIKLWGEHSEDDEMLLRSLRLITEALEGFRYEPINEIQSSRLSSGLQMLETIPEWSPSQFIFHLGNKIGESALEISQGATYHDVASSLETISDERVLQGLILQLLQSEGPHHSKITHGPIEYGRDIVAIVDENSIPILHLYAVKAGDINAQKWREVKESIDQLFTVSINNPLVTQCKPASVRGFLAFNGHFNAHVDPIADGWLRQIREKQDWDIKVIDLEGLSRWVVSHRLVGVFNKFMGQN